MGPRVSGVVIAVSLAGASGLLLVGDADLVHVIGFAVAVALAAACLVLVLTRPPTRLLFRLIIAAALLDVVLLALSGADLRGVALVAHSKGGLIGKHMMLLDDTERRIDRLVAVATPFGGSRYARYMIDPQLRAFRPTERTMAMLTANAMANARITSIYGSVDTHIPEGCALPGATNVEFPVTGHFRVLADERVLTAVDSALAA